MTPQIYAELKAVHAKMDQAIKTGVGVHPNVKALNDRLAGALASGPTAANWQQILQILIQILTAVGPILFPPSPTPTPTNQDNTP